MISWFHLFTVCAGFYILIYIHWHLGSVEFLLQQVQSLAMRKVPCPCIVVMLMEEFSIEQPRGNISLVSVANNFVNYIPSMGCLLRVFVRVLSFTLLGFRQLKIFYSFRQCTIYDSLCIYFLCKEISLLQHL